MVIPDPSASDVPTHHWRTQLRADGLILDQFQLNRQWSEDETKRQIIDKLPLVHRIADIKFMKASYGKLTGFILQEEVPLTCDRLLRLSGQGAIYCQCCDKFTNSIEENNNEFKSSTRMTSSIWNYLKHHQLMIHQLMIHVHLFSDKH